MSHKNEILREKSWKVVCLSGYQHLRINGIVDVWPTRYKCYVVGATGKATNYHNLDELKKFVAAAEEKHRPKPVTITECKDKRPIRQITIQEWKEKFA